MLSACKSKAVVLLARKWMHVSAKELCCCNGMLRVPGKRLQGHNAAFTRGSMSFVAHLVDEDDRVDEVEYDGSLELLDVPVKRLSDHNQTTLQTLWSKVPQRKGTADVVKILQNWEKQGNLLDKEVINRLIDKLYFRTRTFEACRVASWLRSESKRFKLTEHDDLMRMDLAARSRRSSQAKQIFESTPKTEISHTILLNAWLIDGSITKSEAQFNEMKQLKLITKPHPYNIMLCLYKTYEMWDKVTEIYNELKASGISPDLLTYLTLYRSGVELDGLEKDASDLLNRLEESSNSINGYNKMMMLYGYLKKLDCVERIWEKVKGMAPVGFSSYLSALEGFGCCGLIEKVEEIEKAMEEGGRVMTKRQFVSLLREYTALGAMEKAESVLKKMKEQGQFVPIVTYYCFISVYLRQQETDKFMDKMYEALSSGRGKRILPSFYCVLLKAMEVCEERSDVGGAEKLVSMAVKRIIPNNAKLFNSLMKVYLKSETATYGIPERMAAANVEPDDESAQLLQKLDLLK